LTAFYYFGIVLISSGGLIFEVSLTKILALAQGHHLAFLIVSTALLGLGASGTFLSVVYRDNRDLPEFLLWFGPLGFSITSVSSYLAVNRIPIDLVRLGWDVKQIGYLILAYGAFSIPFFFSGLTVATAFSRHELLPGRVYFADLLGATAGAVLPLSLYPVTGPVGSVIAAGVLGIASAGAFRICSSESRRVLPAVALTAAALVLLSTYWLHREWFEVRLSPYKDLNVALNYPGAKHLDSRWNVLSRVDRVDSPAVRFAPGLSLVYTGNLPRQIGLTVDGDQLHAVTDDSTGSPIPFLRYLPSSVMYVLASPQRVLVLDPGGGLDVLMALDFGVPRVEVSEGNPLLVEAVRRASPGLQSRVYEDPRVVIHEAAGRSVLAANRTPFDLIVLPSLKVLGASSMGPYGFAENYVMTREAIAAYYRDLTGTGWLAVTRYLQPVPVQSARIAATLIEGLEAEGLNPEKHLAVLRSWGTITFLVKRNGMTPADIRNLKGFSERLRFDLAAYPGMPASEANRFNRFSEPVYYNMVQSLLDPNDRSRFYHDRLFDVRPVTDDRPFFGYALRLDRLGEIYRQVHEKWMFLIDAGLLVPVMLIQAVFFSVLFVILPLLIRGKGDLGRIGRGEKYRIFTYFSLLGIAFMGIEISMIQRLILFLGNPVYSVSAVLAGLLFFAGLGSLACTRPPLNRPDFQPRILLLLSLAAVLEGFGLPWVLPSLMGLDIGIRLVLSAALLLPIGLLMGMPFPLGIRHLKSGGQGGVIPWAWAVNGSASVAGAILAVWAAMTFGFTAVILSSAAAYGVAAGCLRVRSRDDGSLESRGM
jgi:predicted membrane-bound spermidine synthase